MPCGGPFAFSKVHEKDDSARDSLPLRASLLSDIVIPMRKIAIGIQCVMVALLMHGVSLAQTEDPLKALQQEIKKLEAGQRRIENELRQIKTLLGQSRRQTREPQPFKPVRVSIQDDPFKGRKDARLTLIDFSDYE